MSHGDVVRLKSGGPKMTVTAIGESAIVCVWFDEDFALNHGNFSLSSVKKVHWWTI